MPELPEVQTVINHYEPKLINKIIHSIENPNGYVKVFENGTLNDYNFLLSGKSIKSIFRRGKYIILNLCSGYLLIHLRMTGKLEMDKPNKKNMKHVSFKLKFQDGSNLFFIDVRKFGRLYFSNNLSWLNNKLGIEPLSSEFNSKWLYKLLKSHKRMMKPFLLDQKFIAGLGNIYTDEALWSSGIHPKAISKNINKNRSNLLAIEIKNILNKAIKYQGTTIINFSYGNNKNGNFSDELQIFGKPNLPCPKCKSPIIKKFIAQRGTHFCNKCQKY